MPDARIIDSAPIEGARVTSDGYLVADARCARTGCQTYLARELGLDREGTVTVYRPEAAVFNRDSLATYAGKPVTIDHPSEPVTAANWRTHAVGDVGDEIVRDGEFVRVPFKIMDGAAIEAVRNGTREISMGYTTPISMEDGVAPDGTAYQAVQTGPIRINHLAVVRAARGGKELRIGDSRADHWGAAPLTLIDDKEAPMPNPDLQAVILGDAIANVSAADAAKVEAFKANSTKALADAAAAHDKELAIRDAKITDLESKLADAEGKILADADLDKRVAERATLIDSARKVAKDLVTDGKSDAEIRRAAVVAKFGDAKIEGKSDAYVDAMFDLAVEGVATAPKADPIRDAIAGNPAPVVTDAASGEAKAYADYLASLNPSKEG